MHIQHEPLGDYNVVFMTPWSILVVDDERPVRELLATVLRREGFRVLAAASAEEALELAEHVNCLLTDVMLPKMSGAELARVLRGRLPEVKVIFISGYAGTLLTAEDMRGAEFVQKPFDVRALVATVRNLLNPPGK